MSLAVSRHGYKSESERLIMSFTPEILNTVQFFAGRPMYETETYFPSYNASDFMTLDEDTFGDNVQRVYEAIRPYESDDGNYRFEIATFGSENAGGGDVIFFPTYSSSLTGNNGNVAEMAMKAMAYRGNRFTYVALPGNGLSSPLTRKERKHFTQTGSFYDAHEGTVLPVVTALQEVLREADIVPRHFMSDSAGAAMSDALGMALPKDSVWTVTQNVRTGWRGMGKLELAKGMLLDENKHAEIYKTSSSDAGAVTDALKQLVDDNRPSSYDAKKLL